ncbi:hypothetical protein D3C84_356860 [compost metagenome]
MRAERRLNRGGHGHGTAQIVHGHHLRSGDAQWRAVWRIGQLDARRCARLGTAHAALTDQRCATGQVGGGDQAGDRHRDEVCISDVQRTVGVGQALGFGDQVHGVRCRLEAGRLVGLERFERRQGEALVAGLQGLQGAEDLRHGNPARGRRRHAAHLPALVVGAQRRAFLGAVALEVIERQAAGVGVALNPGHDFLGHRTLIQRVRAFCGDAREHLGQRRVFQQGADGFRAAIGIEKVRGHIR